MFSHLDVFGEEVVGLDGDLREVPEGGEVEEHLHIGLCSVTPAPPNPLVPCEGESLSSEVGQEYCSTQPTRTL